MAGAAVLLGAMWIRTWGQPYLIAATLATIATLALTIRSTARGWWWSLHAILLVFVATAWNAGRDLRLSVNGA